ncbi:MAG: DNA alkylation repair protein [Bacilli bacterium]|nr:DNA alkylation repair protein [Bacilli bacterium]
MYNDLIDYVISLKSEEDCKILQRFFKTDKGQYGEGDLFLGIRVPVLRKISKIYWNKINLKDCEKLLKNKYHEIRLLSLFILIIKYEKNLNDRKEIYNLYLRNTKYINNWDLVDLSSPNIVGKYIYENEIDRNILYKLIESNNLWNIRIAILSTFFFIRNKDYKDIIIMSEMLLNNKEDLIHKALGWMLREVGKRDLNILYLFLDKYCKVMPRTMLRYSIEKLECSKKTVYMRK